MPARVLMQDFTGVPAIVDLAAMRDAMKTLGGDPEKINPLQPAELVIDHSVQVDEFGTANAYDVNSRSSSSATASATPSSNGARPPSAISPPSPRHGHLPPGQPRIPRPRRLHHRIDGEAVAYPDTLVGTDSHTTMINGLGVLGWGVGGIEAEAAMLGQPVSMLVPQVVGYKLTGKLREGATATDLVLTVTEALRKLGVVGKFVEFYGPGIAELPLADRATIANMAPEYGATCGIFPVDAETLRYLAPHRPQRRTDRPRRGLLQGAGPLPHRRRARGRVLRRPSRSTSPPSSPASPAPSARRIASCSRRGGRQLRQAASLPPRPQLPTPLGHAPRCARGQREAGHRHSPAIGALQSPKADARQPSA